MLYEFMRYSALIERPLVKHALNNELEIFVSSLISMLKSVQTQMDADEVDVGMYQPPEMSTVVLQIQWAKLTEAKVMAKMYKRYNYSSIISTWPQAGK